MVLITVRRGRFRWSELVYGMDRECNRKLKPCYGAYTTMDGFSEFSARVGETVHSYLNCGDYVAS
jgi:hypothetical protein